MIKYEMGDMAVRIHVIRMPYFIGNFLKKILKMKY